MQGRVVVNGEVLTQLGTKVDLERDTVTVDGLSISGKIGGKKASYVLINKPGGVISSLSDPEGRAVITDLLNKVRGRVFPVGRLDYDAEGVLLLTNDGDLAHRLTHPNYKVPKVYHIKVSGLPNEKDLKRLKNGVRLEDGRTLPAGVRVIKVTRENSWLELTVHEGRNRLVKRMCMAVGHPVMKLKRVAFAGINLKGLKKGEYRILSPEEVAKLKALVGL